MLNGGVSQFVPKCPVLSPFVLFCPDLSPFRGPRRKRTNGDKTGHFGTNWETPPFSIYPHLAGTGMTGRPGHCTMEMNGRSAVSYLVRTPRVPSFMLILIDLEAMGLLAFQGRRGIASVVRWNLRPVFSGVEFSSLLKMMQGHLHWIIASGAHKLVEIPGGDFLLR